MNASVFSPKVYFHPDLQVVATMTLLEPLDEIKSQKTQVSIDEAAELISEVVNKGDMAVPFEFGVGRERWCEIDNSLKESNLAAFAVAFVVDISVRALPLEIYTRRV